MTQKFSQARKDAFLRALAATGNQTLAAERAKVSRSWVQLQRSEDPAFRAAVEQALAEARATCDRPGLSGMVTEPAMRTARNWSCAAPAARAGASACRWRGRG